jgi:dephospho-CoA kinase
LAEYELAQRAAIELSGALEDSVAEFRRDGLEGSDAQAMLDAQLDRRARLSQADDIIDNSGDIEQLKTRVAALHTRYMELAGD